jgi:hypothetical protein
MRFQVQLHGEVVDRSDLLDGTQSITFEAASEDGRWQISGSVSWNLGMEDRAGEGDMSLRADDGEIIAAVIRAEPGPAADDGLRIALVLEIDGASGSFAGSTGDGEGTLSLRGGDLAGVIELRLAP